ncbi:Uma2 family endonuclease [Rossellomorea vietnamensis]|uniref:Uma2 family endonuclease n=1 Tax=Rossellomorea aquimaris TaxID=189382 RepID=A0A5D4T9Y4_9BACI|nr:Uma2 family endonuclease [Rossellomorea aquimaris]TYS72510.1 Uma2 family endonuclease [Rossellomorea aquimaris]
MAIPDKKEKYSYADYLKWDEGGRFELIDGEVFNMSPAPSRRHQRVLRELSTAFSIFLREEECEVFFAPFDVRLLVENKQDDDINNVVQPDFQRSNLTDEGERISMIKSGAPLHPLSSSFFRSPTIDFQLYEKAGVKEYWLVDPMNESIEMYLLINEQYKFQGVYTKVDTITVNILDGLEIDLNQIFE